MFEFKDRDLDKGVIFSVQETDNLIGIRLCLGYAVEQIKLVVTKRYQQELINASSTRRDEIISDIKHNMIQISTYPIYTTTIIPNSDINARLESYESGCLAHKNQILASIGHVFDEPYVVGMSQIFNKNKDGVYYVGKTFEYRFDKQPYLFLTHTEGKTIEEIDTWIINSRLSGIITEDKYLTRKEMLKLVDQLVAKLDAETMERVNQLANCLNQKYVDEYKVYEVYLEDTKKSWNLLMYLGPTTKNKDAWVQIVTLSKESNNWYDIYSTVMNLNLLDIKFIERLVGYKDIGPFRIIYFSKPILVGHHKVYKIPHTPLRGCKYRVSDKMYALFKNKGITTISRTSSF